MMRWLVFFSLLLSVQVSAQQINVRSGAHNGFSRLVLDVPSGTAWEIYQYINSARIELLEHSGGFDTSTVFDRIDNTFISTIDTDEESIDIGFSCDCVVNVFQEGPRMIVMDISPATDTNPITPDSLELTFLDQRALRLDSTEEDPFIAESIEGQTPHSIVPDKINFLKFEKKLAPLLSQDPGETLHADQLHSTQIELSRQIGVATTRGMLTPSNQILDLGNAPVQPQIDTRIFESTELNQSRSASSQIPHGNIQITNSSDSQNLLEKQFQRSNIIADACTMPELVNIQNWGASNGLSAELARLRSILFGEFDRLDRDIAIKLTKMYLYYGFGAEAKQVLLLDDRLAKANPALMSMAEIMEYGHDQLPSYLEPFSDCNSAAALWSILSIAKIDPNTTINTSAAVLGLNGLPIHLREFIAPELSRRLLAYGDQNAAKAALRSLERGTDSLSPNAIFAKANLELSQGDTEQAQEGFSEVVGSNTEQSAEALIEYVNSHLDEDTEIEEQVATLVEAYAMEMRDSVVGDELARTHVLALGKSGQFSAAFAALSQVRERAEGAHDNTLRSSVMEILTREASDGEFLEHTFTQLNNAPEMISANARFKIAKRLAGLGFFEQGEMILAIEPSYPNISEKKLLEAQISLALSRPNEVLTHLTGETSKDAEELRAQAALSIGDFAKAHSAYSVIGDEENSHRTAWLSDDWSALVDEGTPVYGPVVNLSQNPLENQFELEGMLGRTTLAISESRKARQAIQDLLTSTDSIIPAN